MARNGLKRFMLLCWCWRVFALSIKERDRIICSFLYDTNIHELKTEMEWDGWECDEEMNAIGLCQENVFWSNVMCEGNNITQLLFEHKSVVGTLPADFSQLKELRWIDFTGNHIHGTIPQSYESLTNLVELTLSENHLNGTIPQNIGNLNQLVNLELGMNHLTGSLPSSIGQLTNLIYLSIYETGLNGSLPSEIGSLANLERLEFQKNSFSGSLPTTINSLVKLQYLQLEYNQLTSTLPQNMSQLKHLHLLALEHNHLVGTLPLTLLSLDKLEVIRLYSNLNMSLVNVQLLCEQMKAIQVIEMIGFKNECELHNEIEIKPITDNSFTPSSSLFPLIIVVCGLLFIIFLVAADSYCRQKNDFIDTSPDVNEQDNQQTNRTIELINQQQSKYQITSNPLQVNSSPPTHPSSKSKGSSSSYSRTMLYGDDDDEEDIQIALQNINDHHYYERSINRSTLKLPSYPSNQQQTNQQPTQATLQQQSEFDLHEIAY